MNIPPIGDLTKSQMMDMLLKEEYGFLPPPPTAVGLQIENVTSKITAGNAVHKSVRIVCETCNGYYSFPANYIHPVTDKPVPAFVLINFKPEIPNNYFPVEEIIDNGFAVFSFCYTDVASDDKYFDNGLARVVYPDGKRNDTDCGKIGLWSWAAMRVMDIMQTLPEIDKSRISIVGHSRLGKTALLTGALDERFYCAFSNDSGCSGASISRGNTGETIKDICTKFPYWFCKNYLKYMGNEDALPFDQHFLLACNAPHKVYVASAKEDAWACPPNEYLSCRLASDYYVKMTGDGFNAPKTTPLPGDKFHNGNIGYHIREGKHFLSRNDWNRYFEFLNQ